ncbi:MAG: LytTR family DNA-binding domain-containing protein [Muribaculaceae bacterium]|nr:LytTR family DNA-binding domain-containing protein [Muribaculaceae bacterium]
MSKISCAIVDDEPLAIKLIENYVSRTPFLEHVASYTDSVSASMELGELRPDLVFLDIQMPDMDGLALARLMPAETKIIFTTAFRDYALDSYDVAALDYLLKPIRYDKFIRAAQKAKEWFELQEGNNAEGPASPRQEDIFLKRDGGFQRIELDRIVMIEGMKDYVKVFLQGEKLPIVTHLTMKGIEGNLPAERFMRVSRSHIVSLRHIKSVDRNMCIYVGDTMVKVTDMYKTPFEAFLKGNMLDK